MSLICSSLLSVHSSFAIILKREEEKAGCFVIIVLQMYCYYKCSVSGASSQYRGLVCSV